MREKKPSLTPAVKVESNETVDPSYTNLTLPLRVLCRHRYHYLRILQRKQFLREIREIEALQSKALDGVRIHREFCNPILREPQAREKIIITPAEQRRIEQILHDSMF